MTDHPITPPPELLDNWDNLPISTQEIFVIAAQWGADQELQACCEWLEQNQGRWEIPASLRAARRPQPKSLKEQALEAARIELDPQGKNGALIIRALEQLPK
jgi:hypothetical protein